MPETVKRKIHVFKDDPEWDKHAKWFMLPKEKLEDLHIASYECDEDDFHAAKSFIEIQHKDCVFVY